jgi:hypothetical protein
MTGFIDHLYTKLGTTSNYSDIANLNTLQTTTASAKPFPACCVNSRSMTMAFNSGDYLASLVQVPFVTAARTGLPANS